jgi:hypothetical protein
MVTIVLVWPRMEVWVTIFRLFLVVGVLVQTGLPEVAALTGKVFFGNFFEGLAVIKIF